MAIDGTETIAGASPFAGTGQHRRDFLARARNDAPRGPMEHGAGRQGKKVVTTLLRQSDRSARRALVFGQIRPWKRPFGAVKDTRRAQSLAHSSSARPRSEERHVGKECGG